MAKKTEILVASISRLENGLVVLDFGKGQTLRVAKRFLPKNIKKDDILQVELLSEDQITNRKKNLAQAILNEILDTD